MKFIADENLGIHVPHFLRSVGFDIISIIEINPGEDDPNVLEIASQENRILITLDKDFGELVFKYKFAHSGIIFFRLKDNSIKNKKKIILKVLKSEKNFQGKFTIIREKTEKP